MKNEPKCHLISDVFTGRLAPAPAGLIYVEVEWRGDDVPPEVTRYVVLAMGVYRQRILDNRGSVMKMCETCGTGPINGIPELYPMIELEAGRIDLPDVPNNCEPLGLRLASETIPPEDIQFAWEVAKERMARPEHAAR